MMKCCTGYSNNEHTNVSHGVGDVIGSSVDTSTTDDEVLYCTNVLKQFAKQHMMYQDGTCLFNPLHTSDGFYRQPV